MAYDLNPQQARAAGAQGGKRTTAALLNFEGERLTRAQIADRVGRSLSNTCTLIQKLRKAGIRELKREHFQ